MENTGVRQIATQLADVRADHRERYTFAAQVLDKRGVKFVIDAGCGIGYGSHMLADAGFKVRGYDIDPEAIEFAQQHWQRDGITFKAADAAKLGPFSGQQAAVCFEMLEHVEDPTPILERLARSVDLLVCSVPNELVFPHGGRILHHFRHYTPEEFEQLLNGAGWQVDEWHGQEGPESPVEPNIQGRTVVCVCSRQEKPKGGTFKILPPVIKAPQSVAIVAMGRSAQTYVSLASTRGSRHLVADQTWAINSMGNVVAHDLLFHMDDCKVQEARAEAAPGSNVWGLTRWLKSHPRFFTSKKYEDYPGAMEFPLEEVANNIGSVYFNNTVAYAVAWAIHIGVKKIGMYGCDYSYSNLHKAESGRGCVEFLLGIAAARGIQIEVASDSSLLDANVDPRCKPYGYDAYDVEYSQQDGKIAINKVERETLPTPEEIEERYSHEPPKST